MKMLWSALATVLLVAGVSCSPIEVAAPATDLMPPAEDGPTLATDLMPPALPEEEKRTKRVPATLFLINVYGVKNSTAEDSNDVLHNDVIEEVPEEIAEPLAMFLLIVEDADESKPANLDEVAKDLEEEGFKIEKVSKDGETRLIKVDLGSVESFVRDLGNIEEVPTTTEVASLEEVDQLEDEGKLSKVRRKRHLCLKCMLSDLHSKKYGGGGGCGGGCGGGGGGYYPPPQPQPVYQPVQVVPVVVQKPHGGGGGYYPPPQQCNTCGGGGGGYGHGGGNSYAQASAQASASAQSYGGY